MRLLRVKPLPIKKGGAIPNLILALQLLQEARSDGLVSGSTDFGIALAFEGNIRQILADHEIDSINNNSTAKYYIP